jgi:hypothetical protein
VSADRFHRGAGWDSIDYPLQSEQPRVAYLVYLFFLNSLDVRFAAVRKVGQGNPSSPDSQSAGAWNLGMDATYQNGT